jgi:hypothetical protein
MPRTYNDSGAVASAEAGKVIAKRRYGPNTTANANARAAEAPRLHRETFRTSRLLEFCSQKELVAQTGHQVEDWLVVIAKECTDNALDGSEEAGIAPE